MPLAKQPRVDNHSESIAGSSRLPDQSYSPNKSMEDDMEPEEDDGQRAGVGRAFVERFPISTAGAPISTSRKNEVDLQEYLKSCGPLGDRDLFTTAEILMTTGLTGRARTKHLKGPMYKGKTPWKDNSALLRDIDRLPKGPKWSTAEVSVGEGVHKRTRIVYLRDILQVIRELIGASRFKSCLHYAPERHWTSKRRQCRIYGEMWSGDWWWRTQYLIRNENGTVVPLIIATDETTLTNNPQGPKGYPVYLSIGNISKAVRRRPTKHAMIIVGYLPVDPFDDVADEETRKRYRGELLHQSLGKVFEPLRTASSDGMLAWCADGYLRHVYPIIAAWVADWPEQNDIACTFRSGCPKCLQKWKGRGQGNTEVPLRDHDTIVEAFQAYRRTGQASKLAGLNLKPWPPFWEDLEHVDIGACLTPDLLHQLYKGVFEHARDWVEDLLGTEEFNQRFKSMPLAQDLRHFHKGVTKVKVWAGRESREMMRQFLPVVVDAQAPPEFIRVIRALLDFSYLAHYEQLTDDNLLEMEQALAAFHQAKKILTHGETAVVPGLGAFDRLPKLHMLGHYTQSIRELGTPDGYSTETPEHLHIIYVKNGWRMSNRRDPIPQIVSYVKRLESIYIQRTFIDVFYGECPGVETEEEDMYGDDEDDEGEAGNCNSGGNAATEENDDAEEDDAMCEERGQVELETYYDHRYPRPQIRLARKPTVPQVPGHMLVSAYCASDFTRALRRFLEYKACQLGEDFFLLPSDCFDVWHKATLVHSSPPFADLLPRRDAIRVRPVTRNRNGRIVGPGLSDTGLFATSRDNSGLTQFRAGRVRAIFTLPPRLRHLYSGHLVYLDVFTPFKPDATDSHLMFTTTQAYFDGFPAGLVLPLSCLSMGCHLAPDFSFPPTPAPSLDRADMPTTTFSHFVFNEFYNHFTYLWMAFWRQPYLC